jgi:HAD superfamily hydrolase (TIGR01458 family)
MALPDSLEAVLIDLAGVLHIGDEAIPGAVAALQRLRDSGLALRFLTNTTRTPRGRILESLRQMGFALDEHEVLTAALSTRALVEARGLRPHYLIHPDIRIDMGSSAAEPSAVVLGDAGPYFDFASLNQAFRLLMQGLPLIAMARNRYFKESDGMSLDMGAFVSALEYSAGVKAEIVGKPARSYFEASLQDIGISADKAVMIGDDLLDDLGGAKNAGIAGILVRTGKFRPSDEQHPEFRPDLIADDFAMAVEQLLA